MNLVEEMKDLCYRLRILEKEYEPKIDELENKLQGVNDHYNKLKGKKPNLWLQGMVITVFTPFAVFFAAIAIMKEPNTDSVIPLVIISAFACVILLILNFIRAKTSYAARKKRAEDWWECTGKPAVLTLNKRIDEIAREGGEFLGQNSLVNEIPKYYLTIEHCFAIYEILLQRRAISLEEAFSVYSSDLSAAHQRWMDKYEENKRWEEFSERQAELQRTLEQTNQELAYGELMLDEIRIRNKYGD